MAAMLSAIGGGALEVAGFELVYVTAPGDGVRVGLADVWALRLESVPPVRRFASHRSSMPRALYVPSRKPASIPRIAASWTRSASCSSPRLGRVVAQSLLDVRVSRAMPSGV